MNMKEQVEYYKNKISKLKTELEKKEELLSNKKNTKTLFYTFDQNNSGGKFIKNDYVTQYVIIEAKNYEEANAKADDVGIYFDGCSLEIDCSCCGDRWYPVHENDGKEIPMIRGDNVFEIKKSPYKSECIIYYYDGRKEKVIFKEDN